MEDRFLLYDCNQCKYKCCFSENDICDYCITSKCSYQQKKLCINIDCFICYNRSFDSHPKSKFWDKNKNKDNTRNIIKGSRTKAWFCCEKCNHSFDVRLDHIYHENSWCPYCDNKKRCYKKDCNHCYKNSFESYFRSNFLKDKSIDLRQLSKTSKSKLIFVCNVCNHDFEASVFNITRAESWCPYCVNLKRCCKEDCIHCYKNSFESHSRSKFLKDKNIELRQVSNCSNLKLMFICDVCNNDFKASVFNITRAESWCPHCINKTETKLYNFLLNLKYEVKRQLTIERCKNEISGRFLPYDFVIINKNIIIELDGPQHFVQVSNWIKPEDTILRDVYKMKCAIKNGYSLIRLLQEEVNKDSFDWRKELIDNISTIKNGDILFLTRDNDIYDTHKSLLSLNQTQSVPNH